MFFSNISGINYFINMHKIITLYLFMAERIENTVLYNQVGFLYALFFYGKIILYILSC